MRRCTSANNFSVATVLWLPPGGTLIAQGFDDAAPPGGESNTAVLMFALGILLMLSILTRQLFRAYRRSRRKSPHKTVRQVREESAKLDPRPQTPLVDAPAAYARWHAEMYDVVRQAQAEMDTKIRLLQATIRLAEESSQRLDVLVAQAHALANSLTESVPTNHQTLAHSPTEPTEPTEKVTEDSKTHPFDSVNSHRDINDVTQQLRAQTEQTLRIAGQLRSQSRLSNDGESSREERTQTELRLFPDRADETPIDSLQKRVRHLAAQGLSAAAIAQETGIPHGDVDLYLSTLPFAPQPNPPSPGRET